MNKYELALVISAKLDDNTRADVLERAKDYISRHGGTVGETEEWGKRKLAYEIQKEKEAYYYFVQFETEDSNCPNELEHRMRIMDNVLRYLVVRKGEHDTFSVAPEKSEEAEAAEEDSQVQQMGEGQRDWHGGRGGEEPGRAGSHITGGHRTS